MIAKEIIREYRRPIALVISIICILIIFISYHGFNENQQHDGMPNLLMSTASYITTTLACVIALLFLLE